MTNILKFPLTMIKSLLNFLFENTRPNPKYVKDNAQYLVDHKRSYAMVFNQFFVFFAFCINLAIENGEFAINMTGAICNVICFSSTFLMTRFHPEAHRILINVVNVAFGLIIAMISDEGLHGAWISTSNFPMLMYVATGNLWHFGTNMAIQLIAINFFYKNPMKNSVLYMQPDEFVKSLTYQTNQAILYSMVFTVMNHMLIKEAFYQASVAEKKKEEFESQKNFLLGFSHELRNLMNSLMGNVALASAEAVTEKAKELLANAELCAEMLLHLINNILDTGKVELGDLEINPTPVRIYDTLERVWGVCSELIKDRHLRGRMKIQKNIPQVLNIDNYRLTQIFLNLIGNAVKYTDMGEVDVTVEWLADREIVTDKCFEPVPFNEENDTDEGVFEMEQTLSILNQNLHFLNLVTKKVDRVGLIRPKNYKNGVLKITVRDTGIGIPKNEMTRLFQKFTQVSSDPSRKKLGTGLGLFITKELCQRMNGDVRVYSQQGRGSAFTFCLPIEPVLGINAHLLDRDLMKKLILKKSLKAMVVDDQTFNHIIMREFLHKLGVEVTAYAEDGQIALDKYKAHAASRPEAINIVTMDLSMPNMDGKTAAKKIREYEAQKGLSPCLLLIVSANCVESEISECMDKNGLLKADGFIKKPATVDDISKLLSHYLLKIYTESEIKALSNDL